MFFGEAQLRVLHKGLKFVGLERFLPPKEFGEYWVPQSLIWMDFHYVSSGMTAPCCIWLSSCTSCLFYLPVFTANLLMEDLALLQQLGILKRRHPQT